MDEGFVAVSKVSMATLRRHGQHQIDAESLASSPSGLMPDRLGSSRFSFIALFKLAYKNLNGVFEP